MVPLFRCFKPLSFILVFVLLLILPGGDLKAEQPTGFILLSAGKDGQIGTPEDIYARGKGELIEGTVDLVSLGLTQADLVPSNVKIGGIVVVADSQSAPADGKTELQ